MRNIKNILLSTAALVVGGYDNKIGWKKDDSGALVTDTDGNPIYIGPDGKEQTLAPGYVNKINTEATQYRNQARDLQSKLDAFGDLDPKAARDAVTKMKDVNLDELVNKGEIDNVRNQLKQQFERDIGDRDAKLTDAQKRIERLALDAAFGSSKLLKEQIALPEDVVRAAFRDRFEYDAEKDRVVPKNAMGEPLINKNGDIASVDEALTVYIEARSDKDVWLKAPDASGSGNNGGGGGRSGGNRMKRADFDALPPAEQAAAGTKVSKGELQIVD